MATGDIEVWRADQVKDFIESILTEKDRALSMAGEEREKAAVVLRNEQQRALDQADKERARAAEVLRVELIRDMSEGDDRLRDHVDAQYKQIEAALTSAEKLEIERFKRVEDAVAALAERLAVLHHAAELEQQKFEAVVANRFVQVDEFRGSLDELSKQMATRRETESVSTSLNSKIDESIIQRNIKFDELNTSIQELRSRIDSGPIGLKELQQRSDVGAGELRGAQRNQAALYALIAAVGGVLAILIVAANAISGN